jgi:hypothetical protein
MRLTPAGTPQGAFTPLGGVVRSDAAEGLDQRTYLPLSRSVRKALCSLHSPRMTYNM